MAHYVANCESHPYQAEEELSRTLVRGKCDERALDVEREAADDARIAGRLRHRLGRLTRPKLPRLRGRSRHSVVIRLDERMGSLVPAEAPTGQADELDEGP